MVFESRTREGVFPADLIDGVSRWDDPECVVLGTGSVGGRVYLIKGKA